MGIWGKLVALDCGLRKLLLNSPSPIIATQEVSSLARAPCTLGQVLSLFFFFFWFLLVISFVFIALWFVAVVQWLSHVRLFVTPCAAAHQASLSFTISRSLLKTRVH